MAKSKTDASKTEAKTSKPVDKTRIDIRAQSRAEVCDLFNGLLATASDLTMQAKFAHWNVKGPHFIALHKLFDEVYEALGAHVDEIAERIGALGGHIKGRLQDAAAATTLKPYPENLSDGMAHVRALADAMGQFANELRDGIDACEELEDKVSADTITGIAGDVEKRLWFLEAHLR